MLSSPRYEQDSITVTRATISRGSDGATEGTRETVLSCDGDAQDLEAQAQELEGTFGDGGLRFYATDSVLPCRPGDDATVTLEDGTELETTVERIELTPNALVLSYERES